MNLSQINKIPNGPKILLGNKMNSSVFFLPSGGDFFGLRRFVVRSFLISFIILVVVDSPKKNGVDGGLFFWGFSGLRLLSYDFSKNSSS